MEYICVAVGGGLGAVTRFMVAQLVAARLGMTFPFGTLLINVSGSFAIGVLMVMLTEHLTMDPLWRLLLVVGFPGGYTTFSSYTFEVVALFRLGEPTAALAYVAMSNILGILAALLGILVARLGATG
jgi:fluoride exporter